MKVIQLTAALLFRPKRSNGFAGRISYSVLISYSLLTAPDKSVPVSSPYVAKGELTASMTLIGSYIQNADEQLHD